MALKMEDFEISPKSGDVVSYLHADEPKGIVIASFPKTADRIIA